MTYTTILSVAQMTFLVVQLNFTIGVVKKMRRFQNKLSTSYKIDILSLLYYNVIQKG